MSGTNRRFSTFAAGSNRCSISGPANQPTGWFPRLRWSRRGTAARARGPVPAPYRVGGRAIRRGIVTRTGWLDRRARYAARAIRRRGPSGHPAARSARRRLDARRRAQPSRRRSARRRSGGLDARRRDARRDPLDAIQTSARDPAIRRSGDPAGPTAIRSTRSGSTPARRRSGQQSKRRRAR